MTICKNCGTVYDEFFGICPKCGTTYSPDSDQNEQNAPAKEMPAPVEAQNDYHREFDPSATVILPREPANDADEDATIPNPPTPFPYQADVSPAESPDIPEDDDKTIPLQHEPVSGETGSDAPAEKNADAQPTQDTQETDPDATVIYSSSQDAGMPAVQNETKTENDIAAPEDDTTIPMTMPKAQYGDDFSTASPTSFAPPEQPVDDFSNTQDVILPPIPQNPAAGGQVYTVPSMAEIPSPIMNPEMQAEKKPKKKGSAGKIIAIIIIVCVVLAGIGIGAYFLFANNSSSEDSGDSVSLGEKYLSEEKWDDAIVQFKKAIKNDPNNADLYLKLAEAYEHKKEYGNAIYYLELGYSKTNSDKIKAKLDELRKAHPSSTPEELIGTWSYNYDADSLSPEQKALLEYMNMDTAMAILPNGQLDSYLTVSGRYSRLGSGTWTLSGDTFTLSTYGSEQKYTYKDGKLYDNSSNGGVFFEKTSDDVPEASRSKLIVEDQTSTTEESSEPEEESSKPEEESSVPEEESSSSENPSTEIKEEDIIGTWAYNYDPNLLSEEQRAMLEYLNLDTTMAVLPNGQIDAYLKVGSKYTPIGSGTWTITGDTFTVSSSGSEQKYSYKDGILYDKSTSGGVYFEKISNDVPDASKAKLNPSESSKPAEESSESETSLPKPLNGNAVGTWKIAFDETAVSPAVIAEFKETMLDEFMMVLKEDGTAYARQSLKGNVKKSGTGTWTISGDSVSVTLDNETQKFTFKDGKMTAPDVLGPAYFEKTSDSTDFPDESKPADNPTNDYSVQATEIDYAFKDYYAMIVAGVSPETGMDLSTQSKRQNALKTITVQQALDYAGLSDHVNYLEYMSVDKNGTVFATDKPGSRIADSAKTSVLHTSKGAYILENLYK